MAIQCIIVEDREDDRELLESYIANADFLKLNRWKSKSYPLGRNPTLKTRKQITKAAIFLLAVSTISSG